LACVWGTKADKKGRKGDPFGQKQENLLHCAGKRKPYRVCTSLVGLAKGGRIEKQKKTDGGEEKRGRKKFPPWEKVRLRRGKTLSDESVGQAGSNCRKVQVGGEKGRTGM